MAIRTTKTRTTLTEEMELEIANALLNAASEETYEKIAGKMSFKVSASTVSRVNADYDVDSKGNLKRKTPFGSKK